MRHWRAAVVVFSLAALLSSHALAAGNAKSAEEIAQERERIIENQCLGAVFPYLEKSDGRLTPQARDAYMNWAERCVMGQLQQANQGVAFPCPAEVHTDETLRVAIFGAVFPPDPSILQNYIYLRSSLGEQFAKKYRSLVTAVAVARRIKGMEMGSCPLDVKPAAPPPENKADKSVQLIYVVADFLKANQLTALSVYQDHAKEQQLVGFLAQNKCDGALIAGMKDSGQVAEYLKQAMVRLNQRPANREVQPSIVDWLKYQGWLAENKPTSTPPVGNGRSMSWPIFPVASAPWPLLMSFEYTVPLGEAKFMWETFLGEHGPDRFHTYGPYRGPEEEILYELKPSQWNWNALPDRIINGGECITMSFNTVETYGSLGIPSVFAGQPGHANLMSFHYTNGMWSGQIEQAFAGGPAVTFAQWDFNQDPVRFRSLYNWVGAEYLDGLALGMNGGLQSYMDTRIAVNLYNILPPAQKQSLGPNLLNYALRNNPYNPDVWYRLAMACSDASQAMSLVQWTLHHDPGAIDGEPRNAVLEEFNQAEHDDTVNASLNEYWTTIQEFTARYAILNHPMPQNDDEARSVYALLQIVPGMTRDDLSPYLERFGKGNVAPAVVAKQPSSVEQPAIDATPEQVNAAMDKAKAFLLARQSKGTWEEVATPDQKESSSNGAQYGSLTAMATYALLCANVPENDPRISKAITFLERTPSHGVYATALRCLVWSRLKLQGDVRVAASRDLAILHESMHRTGTIKGTFSYTASPASWADLMPYDNRVSQFAVLGMWSLYSRGMDVSDADWNMIDSAWRAHQYPDGAWLYYDNPAAGWNQHTAFMTATGVSTLFLTSQSLSHGGDGVSAPPDLNIRSGLLWLGTNFGSAFDLPREFNRHQEVDTIFALSRVGAASGYKYIDNIDWYQKSVNYLCQNQQGDGSWISYSGPISATAMGIMSLAYGKAPVVLNKLEYDLAPDPGEGGQDRKSTVESGWNLRPRDLFNFTTWMDNDLQDRFNFQMVDLEDSSWKDLHDAPVLYISGTQELNFYHQDQVKLRQFVHEGGLILGNADGGSKAFAAGFEKLGKELFPSYEFRDLPPDHLIFAKEQKQGGEGGQVAVRGLSNGVRELMLLPQADLSATFDGRMEKSHPELYRLTEGIILYAVGNSGPWQKGITNAVPTVPKKIINKRVDVAFIKYAGNWNPEPGGWWRLTLSMYNHDQTETSAKVVTLEKNTLVAPLAATRPSDDAIRKMAVARISPADIQSIGGDPAKFAELVKVRTVEVQASLDAGKKLFDLARLTGTSAFHLNDEQRHELKKFVDAGGILLIDAAGGSQEFAYSAEAELKIIFGKEADQLNDPLPASALLFSTGPGKIEAFQYRHFAQAKLGSLDKPRLRGIIHDGRLGVIFSREDLSAGLVGNEVDGIIGYQPQTATDIVKSIMLYAAHPESPKTVSS